MMLAAQVGPLRLKDVVKRATQDGCYELVPIHTFTSAQATGSVHGCVSARSRHFEA